MCASSHTRPYSSDFSNPLKNDNDMKKILLLTLMLSFLLPPVTMKAQMDEGTTALINLNGKRTGTLMLVRSAIEEGNVALHSAVADTTKAYKEVNVNLDKYYKACEIIDAIINGACTVVNVYTTYDVVKDRLGGIRNVLQEYADECLAHGRIEPTDTLIIRIGNGMVSAVADDVDDLLSSLYDLTLYVTGVGDCRTARLIEIIQNINDTLNAIKEHVTDAYMKMLSYVKARVSPFWNGKVLFPRNRRQLSQDALAKWIQNSRVLR